MSVVTLVSGGLDSTLMSVLIRRERIEQFPVFVNYGQINKNRELGACKRNFRKHKLPDPAVVDVSHWGRFISSGLTDRRKRVFEDAFLPGRNLMFLLVAASYAYRVNAESIAIGLLDEAKAIFPDQTRAFCNETETLLSRILDRKIFITTPLIRFTKAHVVEAANRLKIRNTYSCHAGTPRPCGICVACREFKF
jgi:7-cyano-7-deazaguanine synthase